MINHQRLTEIDAEIVGETELALKLKTDKGTGWVPRKIVEDHDDGTFTLPEQFAIDKGLV